MLIGHYGVALIGKSYAKRVSLGWMFVSVQLLDLIWPILVAAGVEHVEFVPARNVFLSLHFINYPISHSLLGAFVWAVVAGFAYTHFSRDAKGGWAIACGVLSHWFGDAIVHQHDLPLLPSAHTEIGLGLWQSVPATLLVEGGLFLVGATLYLRATQNRDRAGVRLWWLLAALMVGTYTVNLFPPPTSYLRLGILGFASFALPGILAFWVDRHRISRFS
jgi:hypothetical protein